MTTDRQTPDKKKVIPKCLPCYAGDTKRLRVVYTIANQKIHVGTIESQLVPDIHIVTVELYSLSSGNTHRNNRIPIGYLRKYTQ